MESSDRVSVSAVTALFLHHMFIHLMLSYEAHFAEQPQLICSHQPNIAQPGDDVILSCRLDPPISASSETVEWTRPGLDPEYVHVHQDGRLLHQIQNPSYSRRTRLFVDEMEHGNVSMKIFKVKLSDEGTYRCFIPSVQKEASVQLLVGSVSVTVIEETSGESGEVVLECESKGWYPEPEVLWLDGEGNLLSAGPTETVRGPDDLYTVSSRVTVEKRHSNSFTCRVQQNKTNQTREAHIHVPDDSFTTPSSSSSPASTIIGSVVGIIFITVAVFAVWKWIRKKIKTETNQGASDASGKRENQSNSSEDQPLTEGGEEMEQTRTQNKSSHAESGPGRDEEERQTRDSVSSLFSV